MPVPVDGSGIEITTRAECIAHKAHNADSVFGFEDYNGIITQAEADEMLQVVLSN